jgi:hypothetical protein
MSARPVPAPQVDRCFSGGCRRKATHAASIRVIETGAPASAAEVCKPCLDSYQGAPQYYEVAGVKALAR